MGTICGSTIGGSVGGSTIGGRWIVLGSGNTPTAGEAAKGDCVTNVVEAVVWTYIMNIAQLKQEIIR